jgi:hypothetical protein
MQMANIVAATRIDKKIKETFVSSCIPVALSFFAGAAISNLDFVLEKCDYSTITMGMRVCYSQ